MKTRLRYFSCILMILLPRQCHCSEFFAQRPFLATDGVACELTAPGVSPQDLSAELAVRIRDKTINVSITVHDDKQVVRNRTSRMYKYDCVQIAIHPFDDRSILRTKYMSEIGISPGLEQKSAPRMFKWFGPLRLGKVRAMVTRKGVITTYTISIPVSALGFDLKTTEILFSVLVNDSDGGAQKHLKWSDGIAGLKSPARFGLLALNQAGIGLAGYDMMVVPGAKCRLMFRGNGKRYRVLVTNLVCGRPELLRDAPISMPGCVKIDFSALKPGKNVIRISVYDGKRIIYRARRNVYTLDMQDLKQRLLAAEQQLTQLAHAPAKHNLLKFCIKMFRHYEKTGEYLRYRGMLTEAATLAGRITAGRLRPTMCLDLSNAAPPREILLHCNGGRGYGHQGITTDGKHWFVFHTDSIFRYDNVDFSVDQAKVKRNMHPLDSPVLKKLGVNHLGAPACHGSAVYTFVKSYKKVNGSRTVYIIGFDANTLDCLAETLAPLKMPDLENGYYNTSGGPVIRGDCFYCVLFPVRNRKNQPGRKIGRFSFPSAEFTGFVELKGADYNKPQGLFMDNAGNFYIPETSDGIKLFDAHGNFNRYVFKTGNSSLRRRDVHEGLYHDPASGELLFSMTSHQRIGGGGDYVVMVNLKKDKYRFVNNNFGVDGNLAYTWGQSKKTVACGIRVTVPGQTLLIAGYSRTNPVRETLRAFFKGDKNHPVIWAGYPEPFYITGSDDFSDNGYSFTWKKSSTPGEYYLVGGNQKPPTRIRPVVFAVCHMSAWSRGGMDALRKRTEGTPGHLKPGEWGWGNRDGLSFETLYYRLNAKERIRELHIEAGQREDLIIIDKDYNLCREARCFLANSRSGSGVKISGHGSAVLPLPMGTQDSSTSTAEK